MNAMSNKESREHNEDKEELNSAFIKNEMLKREIEYLKLKAKNLEE